MRLYILLVLLILASCLAKHKSSKKSAAKRSAKKAAKPLKAILPKKTTKAVKQAAKSPLKITSDQDDSDDGSAVEDVAKQVKAKSKKYAQDPGAPTEAPPADDSAAAGGDAGAGGAPPAAGGDAGAGGAPPAAGGAPADASGGSMMQQGQNGMGYGQNNQYNNNNLPPTAMPWQQAINQQACYSTFNTNFNRHNQLPAKHQQYQMLAKCLKASGMCDGDLDGCDAAFAACEKKNKGDEEKEYECNWFWYGCSLDQCPNNL